MDDKQFIESILNAFLIGGDIQSSSPLGKSLIKDWSKNGKTYLNFIISDNTIIVNNDRLQVNSNSLNRIYSMFSVPIIVTWGDTYFKGIMNWLNRKVDTGSSQINSRLYSTIRQYINSNLESGKLEYSSELSSLSAQILQKGLDNIKINDYHKNKLNVISDDNTESEEDETETVDNDNEDNQTNDNVSSENDETVNNGYIKKLIKSFKDEKFSDDFINHYIEDIDHINLNLDSASEVTDAVLKGIIPVGQAVNNKVKSLGNKEYDVEKIDNKYYIKVSNGDNVEVELSDNDAVYIVNEVQFIFIDKELINENSLKNWWSKISTDDDNLKAMWEIMNNIGLSNKTIKRIAEYLSQNPDNDRIFKNGNVRQISEFLSKQLLSQVNDVMGNIKNINKIYNNDNISTIMKNFTTKLFNNNNLITWLEDEMYDVIKNNIK